MQTLAWDISAGSDGDCVGRLACITIIFGHDWFLDVLLKGSSGGKSKEAPYAWALQNSAAVLSPWSPGISPTLKNKRKRGVHVIVVVVTVVVEVTISSSNRNGSKWR